MNSVLTPERDQPVSPQRDPDDALALLQRLNDMANDNSSIATSQLSSSSSSSSSRRSRQSSSSGTIQYANRDSDDTVNYNNPDDIATNPVAHQLYQDHLAAQQTHADRMARQQRAADALAHLANRSQGARDIQANNVQAASKLANVIAKYNVLASAIPAESGPILQARSLHEIWKLCQRMREHYSAIKDYDEFMENALLIYLDKLKAKWENQGDPLTAEQLRNVRNTFRGNFFSTKYLQDEKARLMAQHSQIIADCKAMGEAPPEWLDNYSYPESVPAIGNLCDAPVEQDVASMEKYLIDMCRDFPDRRHAVRVAFNRNPVNMYIRRIIAEKHCQTGKYAYVNKKKDGTMTIKFKGFPEYKKRKRKKGKGGGGRKKKKKEKVGKALVKKLHEYDFFQNMDQKVPPHEDPGDDVGDELDDEMYKHILNIPFKGWQIAKLKTMLHTIMAAKDEGFYDADRDGDDQMSVRDMAKQLQGSFADGRTEASNDEATEVHVYATRDDVNNATKGDKKIGYKQVGNFNGSMEMPPGTNASAIGPGASVAVGPGGASLAPNPGMGGDDFADVDHLNDLMGGNDGVDIDLTKSPTKKQKVNYANGGIGRFHLYYKIDGINTVLLTTRDYLFGGDRIELPSQMLVDDVALRNWQLVYTERFYRNIRNPDHPFYFIFMPPDSTEMRHFQSMYYGILARHVRDDRLARATPATTLEFIYDSVHNSVIRKMAKYLGVDTAYIMEFRYSPGARDISLVFGCAPAKDPDDDVPRTPPPNRVHTFGPIHGLPLYFTRVFLVHGNHYILAFFNFHCNSILVWDSLYDPEDVNQDRINDGVKRKLRNYCKMLKLYMFFYMPRHEDTRAFIANPENPDQMPVVYIRCRRQPNGFACGYHCCYNAQILHNLLYKLHTNGHDIEQLTMEYWLQVSYENHEPVPMEPITIGQLELGGIRSNHHLLWGGYDVRREDFPPNSQHSTYRKSMEIHIKRIQRYILVQRGRQMEQRCKVPAILLEENIFAEEAEDDDPMMKRFIEHPNARDYIENQSWRTIHAHIAGDFIQEYDTTYTPTDRLQRIDDEKNPNYSCIPDNVNHIDQGYLPAWANSDDYKTFAAQIHNRAVTEGVYVNRETERAKLDKMQRNVVSTPANQQAIFPKSDVKPKLATAAKLQSGVLGTKAKKKAKPINMLAGKDPAVIDALMGNLLGGAKPITPKKITYK